MEELGILGLAEYRAALLKSKTPFDYDKPIEGLRALDRYTLQIRLKETRPRLMEVFAQIDTYGAVAREVIEAYPGQAMEHPVGTGPFVLSAWRRSSLITLDRNPGYRERYYDAQPAADDPEGQALLARYKGRRLPMIDQVQVAIIEENQPRWLSFLNRQFDFLERTPEDFIQQALPQGRLAPNLARQGIQAYRALLADQSTEVAEFLSEVRHASRPLTLKVIIESGELASPERIAQATRLALAAGADFVKTSTGKTKVGATPEAAAVMLKEIQASGLPSAGFKASGGVRSVADAAGYIAQAEAALGAGALNPQRLRFGASGLLTDIEAVLGGAASTASTAAY